MSDKRFEGTVGEEYELLKLALPYYDELESAIGRAVRNHCKTRHPAGFINPLIHVVEGGCGTGLTTKEILQASPHIVVTAIDSEQVMLDQATKALQDCRGLVEYKLGDLLEVLGGMKSGSAEVFVSGYMIHNLTFGYRRDLFVEISRILKTGGLFVNGDKCVRDDLEGQEADYEATIRAYDVYDTIGRSDYKAEWIKHYIEHERVRFTEAEQKELLVSNGFKGICLLRRYMMDSVVTAIKA
ncbi:MAG: class I SAM-dependent methyltransferase [Patescibacteria group bacterium]